MGKINWDMAYGVVIGIAENGARYEQGGKQFNGHGIEIDNAGNIVDPNDLIPDKPREEVPEPINGKEAAFAKDWHADRDPPNEYVGFAYDAPVEQWKCDLCGFVSKSKLGLISHKYYKHGVRKKK